jgi:hypothetical protein
MTSPPENWWMTGKLEVIRVKRPIVRNRDNLSPLACVVALPVTWVLGPTLPVNHLELVITPVGVEKVFVTAH